MIGERLRELRLARGMTLRALAEASGLSTALLSQIENGRTDPSVASMRKLAEVFDAQVASLFNDPDAPPVHLSKPGERARLLAPQGLLAYERLTPGRGDLEVLRAEMRPGDVSAEEPRPHPSTECLYVLGGEVVAEVGGQEHAVRAGEALTFDSRLPHRFRTDTTTTASILIAVTPPVP